MSSSSSSSSSPSESSSSWNAVQISRYGNVRDVLEFVHQNRPEIESLGADELLIRVHSAGVNPADWKIIHGFLPNLVPSKFPFTPGYDIGGEVIAVGKNCQRIKVGDRVVAEPGFLKPCAFAEYAITPEKLAATLPASISYSEAAAIPMAGLTSYQALFRHIQLKASDRILILGGSSGTGLFAVQFAKAVGAFVATTSSGRNHPLLKSLPTPPDVLIDYTKDDWAQVLKNSNINVIYDCIGDPKDFPRAYEVLKSDGRFYSLLPGTPGPDAKQFHFEIIYLQSDSEEQWKELVEIIRLIEQKKVRVVIDKVFPFTKEGVEEIFAESETGRTRGKLILEIQKPKVPTNTLSK